jgi:hypothetical protein
VGSTVVDHSNQWRPLLKALSTQSHSAITTPQGKQKKEERQKEKEKGHYISPKGGAKLQSVKPPLVIT